MSFQPIIRHLLTSVLFIFSSFLSQGQTPGVTLCTSSPTCHLPAGYWTFDNTLDDPKYGLGGPSIGTFTDETGNGYTMTAGNGQLNPELSSQGAVGTGIRFDSHINGSNNTHSRQIYNTVFPISGSQRTIEFFAKIGSIHQPLHVHAYGVAFALNPTSIQIGTGYKDGTENFWEVKTIPLNGVDRKSVDYYLDDDWHHFVISTDIEQGELTMYIDGLTSSDFQLSFQGSSSYVFRKKSFTPTPFSRIEVSYHSNGPIRKYIGEFDEFAAYTTVIPSQMVYQHYIDALNGLHYNFDNSNPPTVPAMPDLNGEPAHHDYPSDANSGTNWLSSISAIEQLEKFPNPRYHPSTNLNSNVNWLQLDYLAGRTLLGSTNQVMFDNAKDINRELAENWNYHLEVFRSSSYSANVPSSSYAGNLIDQANNNPNLPVCVRTLWNISNNPSSNPDNIGFNINKKHLLYQDLDSFYSVCTDVYLDNQIDTCPQYVASGGSNYLKRISPIAPSYLGTYDGDDTYEYQLKRVVENDLGQINLTRPINLIAENGEVINNLESDFIAWCDLDSVVGAELYQGTPYSSLSGQQKREYVAQEIKGKQYKAYRDKLLQRLSSAQNGLHENAKLTFYDMREFEDYAFEWSHSRESNSTFNGQYYSTPEFYEDGSNLRLITKMKDIAEGREYEISSGDNLFSPYVSPGWNTDPTKNTRPNAWLGWLKLMGALGADFYYPFHLTSCGTSVSTCQDPSDYAWQSSIPSYAQSISSRYENILTNSSLMSGNIYPNVSSSTNPITFDFKSNLGDPNKSYDPRMRTFIRKDDSLDIFVIVAATIPTGNSIENTQPILTNTIKLSGSGVTTENIKIESRIRGSVYVYDKSDLNDIVFYQLDGWHEKAHPEQWSNTFTFENELYDNTLGTFDIKSEGITASAGITDLTNVTSYIKFPNDQGTDTSPTTLSNALLDAAHYHFQPRINSYAGDYELSIRARYNSTTILNRKKFVMVYLDDVYLGDIEVNESSWEWFTFEDTIFASVQPFDLYKLSLVPRSSDIELEQFTLFPLNSIGVIPINNTYLEVTWNNLKGKNDYNLERSLDGQSFEVIQTYAGNSSEFSYSDRNINLDQTYFYRISQFTDEGILQTKIVSSKIASVFEFGIYPNPGEETVNISMTVPSDSDISIEVFNLAGVKVAQKSMFAEKGEFQTGLSLKTLSSGLYLVRVNGNNFNDSKKFVLQ